MKPLTLPTVPRLALTALLGLTLGACAMYPAAPASYTNNALVGPTGMSLYTFDRDPLDAGKSVCNGPCANNWPPFMAPANAQSHGDWQAIRRDDGQLQWAYRGKPLYYWSKDQRPGDRTGDGFNQVWHLAR